MSTRRPVTASNEPSSLGSDCRSACSKLTFTRPSSEIRSRAVSIGARSRSIPTTCPRVPTSRAVRIDTSPRPQPMSSTRMSSCMPASIKSRRVKSSARSCARSFMRSLLLWLSFVVARRADRHEMFHVNPFFSGWLASFVSRESKFPAGCGAVFCALIGARSGDEIRKLVSRESLRCGCDRRSSGRDDRSARDVSRESAGAGCYRLTRLAAISEFDANDDR